ncbi:MAG: T9SS type A sorting domain-containing protein [Bacteroidia bacterium]
MNEPAKPSFSVSPNPARGKTIVQLDEPFTGHISLIDAYGKQQLRLVVKDVREQEIRWPANLPPGIYLIRLQSGVSRLEQKIVIAP